MSENEENVLYATQHANFIRKTSKAEGTVEYEFTEHLRMSGAYWGVAALSLLKEHLAEDGKDDEEKEKAVDDLVQWILACQCGGITFCQSS